jgi:hypothetical protein
MVLVIKAAKASSDVPLVNLLTGIGSGQIRHYFRGLSPVPALFSCSCA